MGFQVPPIIGSILWIRLINYYYFQFLLSTSILTHLIVQKVKRFEPRPKYWWKKCVDTTNANIVVKKIDSHSKSEGWKVMKQK